MKKLLVLLILITLVGGGAYWYRRNGKKEDPNKLQLITAKVERGTITSYVRTTGRVVANRDVEIKCKASGMVISLTKDVSDTARPGELLLELDPVDELRAVRQAEVNVSMSQARLQQSKESVKIAESTLESDKAKAIAAYNSAVAKSRDSHEKANRMKQLLEKQLASPEEYESAETAAVQATTELKNATIKRDNDIKTQEMSLELKRQDIKLAEADVVQDQISSATAHQRLTDTKVYAPAIDKDLTRADESDSTATSAFGGGPRGGRGMRGGRGPGGPGAFDSATTGAFAGRGGFGGGRGMRGWPPGGAEGDLATSAALAAAARFEGARGQPGGGDPDRAFPGPGFRRDSAEARPPTASNEGVWCVADRKVQKGQIIASGVSNVGGGTTIMTLSDLSHVFIYANVDESDIGKVEVGQEAEITADAYANETFRGKVIRIATKGLVNSNVVTFEVRIEVTSRNKTFLKPEMTANVDVVAAHREDTLVVPSEVVMRRRGQQIVLLKNDDGSSTAQPVELGVTDGFKTELVSGVAEGATVVAYKMEADSRWRGGGGPGGPGRGGPAGMMMMGGGPGRGGPRGGGGGGGGRGR